MKLFRLQGYPLHNALLAEFSAEVFSVPQVLIGGWQGAIKMVGYS